MKRRRVVATVVAVVVLLAGVATLLLWPEPEPKKAAAPPPSPSASPSPSPSPTPTRDRPPYPYFWPGECFDHPQLSKVITVPELRPCEAPHDGEGVAVIKLPEGLADDADIAQALRELCKPAAAEWQAKQPAGGRYFGYPIGPSMKYYGQGHRDASCTLSASNRQDGPKLTGHLAGATAAP
ncbi:hypothetical protein ACIRBX_19910 [Kitasatospora sp. NPDC096147]|uniref:hypothetical protein n=1 Tax=Kitasatospora sp. NPDC096147 TaxID=3364093 RepID=UPI00382B79B3